MQRDGSRFVINKRLTFCRTTIVDEFWQSHKLQDQDNDPDLSLIIRLKVNDQPDKHLGGVLLWLKPTRPGETHWCVKIDALKSIIKSSDGTENRTQIVISKGRMRRP